MKYDFSVVLNSMVSGVPMTLDVTDNTPLTAKKALQFALIQDKPDNEATKLQRYDLYVKLGTCDEKTNFSAEEVKILKDAALKQPTLVAGQLVHLLDQRK
jgi:hypothetical protein